MFRTHFTIIVMLVLSLLPGRLAAQSRDSGEYVILNAQYGTERNHVDVTYRLRELARRDRPFRVNHESMDADPEHGAAKALRVFARDANGREQMFEFVDGSVFDGAMFRSWRRADWGDEHWDGGWNGRRGNDAGDYWILSAQYGSERHHVDVTNQLRDMARQDRVFQLSYRTFGDPDEGHAKSLRIFARGPDGQETMFEYQDNSVIDGSRFRGWGNGDWGDEHWNGGWNVRSDAGQFVILGAQYGNERRHVDVTDRLKELARQDRMFRLDYRTFGVDPDEGHGKSLRIYVRGPNGREQMFEYRDGSWIDGAQFRGWGRGDWGHDRRGGRWEAEEREERERDRH